MTVFHILQDSVLFPIQRLKLYFFNIYSRPPADGATSSAICGHPKRQIPDHSGKQDCWWHTSRAQLSAIPDFPTTSKLRWFLAIMRWFHPQREHHP